MLRMHFWLAPASSHRTLAVVRPLAVGRWPTACPGSSPWRAASCLRSMSRPAVDRPTSPNGPFNNNWSDGHNWRDPAPPGPGDNSEFSPIPNSGYGSIDDIPFTGSMS